jgi:hypothetical protein
MTTNKRLPTEVHPVHNALVRFHTLVKGWLGEVQLLNSEVAKVRRATARAMGAVEVASGGFRRAHNLKIAQSAMLTARSGFRLFELEGAISPEVFDEAWRRIDQIWIGLERLLAVGATSWSTVELPALEPAPDKVQDGPALTFLRQILVDVDEARRSIREREGLTAGDEAEARLSAA